MAGVWSAGVTKGTGRTFSGVWYICKKYDGKIIINGESIGQVASQTLTSMNVINSVTNMPVIRPVACLDKLEIMEIARKLGTYEISILPFEDCCTVFVPKHPVINPTIETSVEEPIIETEEITEAETEDDTSEDDDGDLPASIKNDVKSVFLIKAPDLLGI